MPNTQTATEINLKHNTGNVVHAGTAARTPLCGAVKRAGRRQASGWTGTTAPVTCSKCQSLVQLVKQAENPSSPRSEIQATPHTPLPWKYQEESDAYTHIVRAGERFLCQFAQDTSGEAEANARLIVAAVNSHAALYEALRPFAELGMDLTDAGCHHGICTAEECGRCGRVLAARAALALIDRPGEEGKVND